MQKVPTLFQRDWQGDRSRVLPEVVPEPAWVLRGEGIATRKYDGTACRVRAGQLRKRYDVKAGKWPPAGFEPAQDPDPETGHWPGWLPVINDPSDVWHWEAWFGVGG